MRVRPAVGGLRRLESWRASVRRALCLVDRVEHRVEIRVGLDVRRLSHRRRNLAPTAAPAVPGVQGVTLPDFLLDDRQRRRVGRLAAARPVVVPLERRARLARLFVGVARLLAGVGLVDRELERRFGLIELREPLPEIPVVQVLEFVPADRPERRAKTSARSRRRPSTRAR